MSLKTVKFGGSSLADAEQIRKVADIIHADDGRRFVVPSAPGKRFDGDTKITDLLYLCHTHITQGVPFDDVYNIICKRYLDIARELGIVLNLSPYLKEIRENITQGASADYIASRGEYLNGLIMADLLNFPFVDPADFISFDAQGQFDGERTHNLLGAELRKLGRAVVPGFYGALPDGSIKTFSRGGSDITGAIVARAADVSLYENWTDVSGFLMTDPRIVENPKPIERITYRELRELSYMGATVLHEDAIFPVRQAGIPIAIKNTNRPQDSGTLIVNGYDAPPAPVTGIAGRKGFTVIQVEKAMMNQELGFGRRLLGVLEDNHVSFEHMPSGIDTLSVVISDQQLDNKLETLLAGIRNRCAPDHMDVHRDMALIATVGTGMSKRLGVSATLFGALYQAGVNVRMIDQGSSEMNIIVGVDIGDFDRALNAIYQAFAGAT